MGAKGQQVQFAPIEFTSSTDPLVSLAGTGMSNDMGPAEKIPQDGRRDVEPAREREVRCQDVGGEDPSSSLSYVRQSEEPVTGPLIPAGNESDDEVVVSGVVGSNDEGSWHGQFDDAEEGDSGRVRGGR